MRTRFLAALAVCGLAVSGTGVRAADKSSARPNVISVPSGPGSVSGLGESFEANLNAGSVKESVSLEVPPGTGGLAPALSLSYDSGAGNGPLGIGWSLGLSTIQVQTEKGLPRYDGTDRYLLDGAELVPLGGGVYRLKNEGRFVRARAAGDHWEVDLPDGKTLRYGVSPDARVTDATGARVFAWALEDVIDRFGNRIGYFYERDRGQLYLAEIQYNRRAGTADARTTFEYEARADALSDCRARFCVTTARRLRLVSMSAQGQLVRRYRLDYDEANGLSLLTAVTQIGSDGATTLPPVRFWYSPFAAAGEPLGMSSVPASVPGPGASNDELVDVDGDGYPDLLHAEAGRHWYALNQGGRRFGPRVDMAWSPSVALSASGVEVADLNGDGLPDLVAKTGASSSTFRYFPGDGTGGWKPSVAFSNNPPFGFEDPNVRLLDGDGDKLVDAVQLTTSGFTLWRNRGDGTWEGPFTAALPPGATALSFSDPHLRLADVNGDRLLDLVYVRSGAVTWWPNRGWCDFGAPQDLAGAPAPGTAREGSLLLADVNGDGLSDLVLPDTDHVDVWPLLPSGAFGQVIRIDGTPSYQPTISALRLADLNGNGSTDLAWVTPTAGDAQRLVYLDLVGDLRPNLLVAVENGLGKAVQLFYSSSGAAYQESRDAGQPWATRVPFPVQILAARRVTDSLGHAYDTGYAYRDGWYAPDTREFRGFAGVTVTEIGSAQEATAVTSYRFDLGASLEARKGLPLQVDLRDAAGALVRREVHTYQDRVYATGVDGTAVAGSDHVRLDVEHWEKSTSPALTREEWSYDDYGNVSAHSEWGIVAGEDVRAGHDERLTTTTWANDTVTWLLGRAVESTVTDGSGSRFAASRSYYDGQPFVGLPLGRLGATGALTRTEAWVEADRWAQLERVQRDEYGLVIARLDPLGNRQEIDYDAVSHCYPVASRSFDGERVVAVRAEYDLVQGSLLHYRDEAGRETSFAWDPLHRLTRIARPGDSLAAPTRSFEYTLGSPLSSVRTRSRVLIGGADMVEAWQWFDGLGRALGTVAQAEDGQTVTAGRREYGAGDRVLREYEPFFGHGYGLQLGATFTQRDYDERSRTVRTVFPDGTRAEERYQPLAVERWDSEDLDPASPHARTPRTERYDGLGLAEVDERLGSDVLHTFYARDPNGNVVSITDAVGNITFWTFDGLERIRSVTDADSGTVTFDVDDGGNVLRRVDARGAVVEASYDAFRRPTSQRLVAASGVEEDRIAFHYDDPSPLFTGDVATGALAWVEDGAGEEHYRHDLRGRPVEAVRKLDGKSYRLTEALDEDGRVVQRTYPDGRVITYQRNVRGLLESVPGLLDVTHYDAAGGFTRREHRNGVVTEATYDLMHRLASLDTRAPAKPLQALRYEYDQVGNVTVIADGIRSAGPLSAGRQSRYDDLYRLTEVLSADQRWTYAFNAAGDVTAKSDVGPFTLGKAHQVLAAGGKSYGYDEAGNMTQRPGASLAFDARERLSNVVLQDGTAIRYRYGYAGHRVVKESTGPAGIHRTVYVGEVYEERDGVGSSYLVEGGARLARFGTAGNSPALAAAGTTGATAPPGRDAFGLVAAALALALASARRRGFVPLAAATTACAAATVGIIACGGGGGGGSTATTTPIAALYYHGDHLGSTTVLSDQNGSVVEELSYDPWGKELVEATEPHAYTGKEYERESGLYDYAARAYDPILARFISPDPIAEVQYNGGVYDPGTGLHDYGARMYWPRIGRFVSPALLGGIIANPASLNRYAYVLNNPCRWVDPTGNVNESPPGNDEKPAGRGRIMGAAQKDGEPGTARGYFKQLGIDGARTRARMARAAGDEEEALLHEAEASRLEALAAEEEAVSGAHFEDYAIRRGIPLRRGVTADLSKGTTLPRTLREKLAVKAAQAAPRAGTRLPLKMTDPRWSASDGWVKMDQVIQAGGRDGAIRVHYVYNDTSGAVDDFKIVLPGPR